MRPGHWWYTIPLRLRSLFRREQADQELDEELHDHVARKTEEFVAQGMNPQEARRQAQLEMGGVEKRKEECREARRVVWLQDLIQDLRYGLRMLRKSPSFTGVAVLMLSLGIGANTAIFSITDAVLFRPLPVQRPAELVRIDSYFSNPLYRELSRRNHVFSGLLARQITVVSLLTTAQAERGSAELVSGNYFSVLGVQPFLGRMISDADDRVTMGSAVAVLSHRYWRRELAADPTVVGKTVRIDHYPFTVIGVAPPGFLGVEVGSAPDVWVPITMQPELWERGQPVLENTGDAWLNLMGRRAPGVTEAQARAGLDITFQQIVAEGQQNLYSNSTSKVTLELQPGATGFSALRDHFKTALFLLSLEVVLVLVISCVNLASLVVARSVARRKETAVRIAFGAGRSRLARQFLTENILLALLGGALGFLFSIWGIHILLGLFPAASAVASESVPLTLSITINTRLVGITFLVAAATCVLFGVAPAIQAAKSNIAASLKNEEFVFSSSPHRFTLRRMLVVPQIVFCLVLLVCAGLFLRSLRNAIHVSSGLDTENVLVASMNPELNGYSPVQMENFFRQLRMRLLADPGVQAVGTAAYPLLSGTSTVAAFIIPGRPLPSNFRDRGILLNEVGADFLRATGGRILRGRDFGPQDTATSTVALIINQAAARHFFPGEDPLGKMVRVNRQKNVEIVGIANDASYTSVLKPQQPIAYVNFEQDPEKQFSDSEGQRTLYIRMTGDPRATIPMLLRDVRALDGSLPVYGVKTFADQKRESLVRERLIALLSGFFGALALLLASLGTYGVMAHSVERRIHEISIRLALGARPSAVLQMVMRDSLAMVTTGIAIGLLLCLWLSRFLASLLFGVSPNDATAFCFATLVLMSVAALASYIPARRAMRVDPMVALRYE